MSIIKTYVVTLLVFLAIDSVWLGVIAPDFYAQYIGHLMTDNVNYGAAAAFYLLYIGGIMKFAIMATDAAEGWKKASMNGALFGLIAYATYDLTNFAVMRDWPMIVTVADMAWGAFITGATASVGYIVHHKWVVRIH